MTATTLPIPPSSSSPSASSSNTSSPASTPPSRSPSASSPFGFSPSHSGSEIISLNVGGKVFTTRRSTLMALPDTYLASMFSGRWEGGQTRDEKGRVFLDYTPSLFKNLLSVLRALDGSISPSPSLLDDLDIPPAFQAEWDRMLEFLGVRAALKDYWRKFVAVGCHLDAQDQDGHWYESVVMNVVKESGMAHIHYVGWDGKWDEFIKMDSARLAPLHTYTSDWRPAITVGCKVEVKPEDGKWYAGTVVKVNGDKVEVKRLDLQGVASYDLRSDAITYPGHHIPWLRHLAGCGEENRGSAAPE